MNYTGNNKHIQGTYTLYDCGPRGEQCGTGHVWRFSRGQIKSERLMGYCTTLPHWPAWYSIEAARTLEVLESWDSSRANDPNVVFRLKKEENMDYLGDATLEKVA